MHTLPLTFTGAARAQLARDRPASYPLTPSPYEALFVSSAHGELEIERTVEAFDRALEAEVITDRPCT